MVRVSVALLVAATLLTLHAAAVHSVAAAAAKPTLAQIKKDLNALQAVLQSSKNFNMFVRGVQQMKKYPSASLLPMAGTTILVPSNKALLSLGLNTLSNMAAMKAIGMYNVLLGRKTFAQLLATPTGTSLATITPSVNMTLAVAGKKVSFQVPGVTPARVASIPADGKNLFIKGKWITAQGTDNYLKPPSLS